MLKMKIIESESLELLEFYKVKKYVTDFCHRNGAKHKVTQLFIIENHEHLITELNRVSELKNTKI